ncbi:hypothetical protein SAMN02745687_01914 [Lachnospiraceae bacterium NK3A20]|nr:hypothetical protein SAMN02745687_01914 [Lachnospiraceae bacterium NK3A20]
MFGYVVINQQELKFKEFDRYRAYYCGFCRKLKEKYGLFGQLTLSYDMTFLILLLSDLYDVKDEIGKTRCVAHPLMSHPTRINRITDYCADMNLILSYYSSIDDWSDEHKLRGLMMSKLLTKGKTEAAVNYGHKAAVIKDRLDKLSACEKKGEKNIDIPAGLFGDIMAELFAMNDDEWENTLRRMGFYLGKFIYIMDAYDDLEKDGKSGSYNALLQESGRPDFDAYVKQILTMMMAQCCESFEVLPCVENVPILRNILYSGVWSRYNALEAQIKGDNTNS